MDFKEKNKYLLRVLNDLKLFIIQMIIRCITVATQIRVTIL